MIIDMTGWRPEAFVEMLSRWRGWRTGLSDSSRILISSNLSCASLSPSLLEIWYP